MNKGDLITIVAEEADISYNQATEVLNTLLDAVSDSLKEGKKVSIHGFGVFSIFHRKSRMGRNPKTEEAIVVPEKNLVKFKAGTDLLNNVNSDLARVKS